MTRTEHGLSLLETGGSARLRVQLQFDNQGDRALEVYEWLAARYTHMHVDCRAQPGLCVTVDVPDAQVDGYGRWHAKLVAALSPVDLALELVAECLEDLDVTPARLVSLHATG